MSTRRSRAAFLAVSVLFVIGGAVPIAAASAASPAASPAASATGSPAPTPVATSFSTDPGAETPDDVTLVIPHHGPAALLDSVLDDLVADGTLSEEQATKVLEAFEQALPALPDHRVEGPRHAPGSGAVGGEHGMPLDSILSDLVTDGTITHDQKTAILEAVQAAHPERGAPWAVRPYPVDAFDSVLDGLVSDGTITEEQRQEIVDRLAAARPPWRELREPLELEAPEPGGP